MNYCISCMYPMEQEYEVCPHCGYVKTRYLHDCRLIEPETRLDNRYFIGKAMYIDNFGASYLAFDEIMQRKVVIRQMIDNLTNNNDKNFNTYNFYQFQKRERFIQFYNELSRLSNLTAIPEIFSSKTINNITYAVYEYISEKTIEDFIIINGKQDYSKTLHIVFPMVYALREIHSKNMYHGLINTRNLKMSSDNIAIMYEFPGIEINQQSADKPNNIINQNQQNDVLNVILLILMIITGSIKPINKNFINIEYFNDNEIVMPEMLQNFILYALSADVNNNDITIENLLNAMSESLPIDEYKTQPQASIRIPKSVYETAAEIGCKIKYCITSLEDIVSESSLENVDRKDSTTE